MKILQLISHLLDYPDEALAKNLPELTRWVEQADELDGEVRESILHFIEYQRQRDLLDWQSEYEGLFERGRAVSLHIFEHIYGESRDRGQAMVELLKHYREAGLELSERELPDYLPTYLEFCATQETAAREWLEQIAHVLALLSARLRQKESVYAHLLTGLLGLIGLNVDMTALAEVVSKEEPDDTPEALDKIWEEEAVSFSAGGSCDQSVQRPAAAQFMGEEPIVWADEGRNSATPG
ncbi:nitrate reductase molybdenum cofactor assembly chaperone [Microbulbifer sp.]|uniref:nitrate reductase molybdenum cofactor assembly chaperone n=1 Tax=Microbulbifer sp. TaxID=1908541 RepID=UPI003F35264B